LEKDVSGLLLRVILFDAQYSISLCCIFEKKSTAMRKIFSFVFLVLSSSVSFAQDFTGYHSGNWAGINALHINPANVVDSRFKVDINLFSFNAGIANDYIGMSLSPVFNPDLFNVSNFSDVYLMRDSLSPLKNMGMNVRLQLPSFMFNISPKDAIGITINSRVNVNVDDMTADVAELIWNGVKQQDVNTNFDGAYTTVNTMAWTEIGLTYGRVILDQEQHFLKAGITPKFLLGHGSAYATLRDFNFSFSHPDTIANLQGEVRYGHSSNLGFNEDDISPGKLAGFGLGLDIGVVYEWRPQWSKYKYNMDGKTNLWRKDKEKYLLKAGVSFVDLGSVRFTKAAGSRDYTANVNDLTMSFFDGVNSLYDLSARLAQLPGLTQDNTDNEVFLMATPASFIGQLDWQIVEGVFLNFTSMIAFNAASGLNSRVHNGNSFIFTPRFEHSWFGVYMPIGFRSLTGFNWGVSLRMGPLFVGSSSLISNLLSDYTRGADVYLGLKIPIPHGRPRDRDNDEVSDRKDKCRDVPGVWAFEGCPDTDGDGIPDDRDACPTIAGLAAFNGCPDTDGDGIQDKDDACPDVAGPKETGGCPDTDGDGIADKDDECPNEAGLLAFKGCPDRDGDGIPDRDDACPDYAGPAHSRGCPDTDGDGIYDDKDKCPTIPGVPELDGCPYLDRDGDGVRDKDDKCPDVPGPAENNGCPYTDTDGDGIPDKDDKCPTLAGVPENFGCPPIEKEEKEVLQSAFDNLEFATGKSIIAAQSLPSLDALAEVLLKKPEYKLLVEGHTDNQGKRETNVALSRSRALAVKSYLQKKGINGDRILTQAYGPDKPVADNATEEGRQRNRRVEMTVVR